MTSTADSSDEAKDATKTKTGLTPNPGFDSSRLLVRYDRTKQRSILLMDFNSVIVFRYGDIRREESGRADRRLQSGTNNPTRRSWVSQPLERGFPLHAATVRSSTPSPLRELYSGNAGCVSSTSTCAVGSLISASAVGSSTWIRSRFVALRTPSSDDPTHELPATTTLLTSSRRFRSQSRFTQAPRSPRVVVRSPPEPLRRRPGTSRRRSRPRGARPVA